MGFFSCSQAQTKVDLTPIEHFDLHKYMGLWYEIARFDISFERGMTNVTAKYSVLENGMVRVENSGDKNGKRKMAIGKAKVDRANAPGVLKVAFFLNFYAPYNVIFLDKEYKYALVASGENYLWILAREPQIESCALHEILVEAKKRGFDTKKLIFNSQGK